MITTPFPMPSESDSAHRIAMQAVKDAGLQPHQSSGGKSTVAAQAMANILERAQVHRKVNSGVPAVGRPTGPWYRRFDKR